MTPEQIKSLLDDVAAGRQSSQQALSRLKDLPFEALSYASIDHHRALRQDRPEVIFAEGKTVDQVVGICTRIAERHGRFLCTRTTADQRAALRIGWPEAEIDELGRTVWLRGTEVAGKTTRLPVLVVTAGTSDIPVANEAAVAAMAFGAAVNRVTDVGVAGLHRLLAAKQPLDEAGAVIVVAGMEGALPSVVGGLVAVPVIAVPTSVGYGASFGGIAALLGMLNSCAAGVTVVNIDNGFGAGVAAARIVGLAQPDRG